MQPRIADMLALQLKERDLHNFIRNNVLIGVQTKLRQIRAVASLRKRGHFNFYGQPLYVSMNFVFFERILKEGVFEPEILSTMGFLSEQNSLRCENIWH